MQLRGLDAKFFKITYDLSYEEVTHFWKSLYPPSGWTVNLFSPPKKLLISRILTINKINFRFVLIAPSPSWRLFNMSSHEIQEMHALGYRWKPSTILGTTPDFQIGALNFEPFVGDKELYWIWTFLDVTRDFIFEWKCYSRDFPLNLYSHAK